MAFTSQCITWAEFMKNPSKWSEIHFDKIHVDKIDDSKRALLLPLFDPNDSNYQVSPDFEAIYEIERKRALEPVKIEQKPEEPAILKEMNELSELLYGPD